MKHYKVSVNGVLQKAQTCVVSAFPINRVWEGKQRAKEQAEEAYVVSFDLLSKSEIQIEVDTEFERYEIRPRTFEVKAR